VDIISSLELQLDRIVEEFEKPAAEFAEALADLVEQRSWGDLEKLFGPDGSRQIRDSFNKDPVGIVLRLREAADACKTRFVEDASRQLTRLSQSNFSQLKPHDFAEWLQTAFDPKRDLLYVAFAYKLMGLVRPATERARELRDLVLKEATSEDADKYLSEACDCYFLGLYSASAVMCRSLLEEALERKLPVGLLEQWKRKAQSKGQELTLGNLLWRANNHAPLPVTPKFLELARKVNVIASTSAHKKAINQVEARDCLLKTRQALTILLGANP